MKKNIFFLGMAALALASCSGNPYDSWVDPQHSDPEDAKTVALALAPAAAIDFASLTADSVQLFVPTVTVADQAENTYDVVLNNEDKTATQTVTATENGMVATSDLKSAYYTLVGRKPVSRTIDLNVTSYTKINGESVKEQGTTTATLKADAPEIESVYYVTGYNDDWDNTHTTYRVVNGGGDPYDDPVFTVTLPDYGKDIEFKLTPASGVGGDWSKCITAAVDGTEGKLADSNAGGNLKIKHDANAKFYRVTFDLLNQTWSYESLSFGTYLYEIGGESIWSTNHILYGASGDGNYVGYYYLNGEFKFKPNADNWDGDYEYNGAGKIADNGGSNLPDPGAGFYQISVDLVHLTYKLYKINQISIIGGFNNWSSDVDLTYNAANNVWEANNVNIAKSGELKFRCNHKWGSDTESVPDFGGSVNSLTTGGGNFNVEAGTYDVKLYLDYDGHSHATFTKK